MRQAKGSVGRYAVRHSPRLARHRRDPVRDATMPGNLSAAPSTGSMQSGIAVAGRRCDDGDQCRCRGAYLTACVAGVGGARPVPGILPSLRDCQNGGLVEGHASRHIVQRIPPNFNPACFVIGSAAAFLQIRGGFHNFAARFGRRDFVAAGARAQPNVGRICS